MENKDIKNILNTLYEIEGIAEMALRLPVSEKRNAFCKLVADKCYLLANSVAEIPIDNDTFNEEDDLSEEIVSHKDSEAIEKSENEQAPQSEKSEIYGIPAEIEEDEENIIPTNEKEISQSENTDEDIASTDIFTYAFEPEEENEEIEEDEKNKNFIHEGKERRDLKKLFTISDKYRFTRELFGNSPIEYKTNLDLVMSMQNYAEAEEYFFGDLQWDRESEDANDFMAIIFKYFS